MLDDKERYEYFCEEYNHLGRMIVNFIKSVDSSHKTIDICFSKGIMVTRMRRRTGDG